jgi:chlorophyll/bacteriochlorophyll a synthase
MTVSSLAHPESKAEVAQRPDPRAVLTLLKPVTWFPPMWAFSCGVVSSGVALTAERGWVLALGIALTGPLVCASSQAVNDWFDRHVDAINEPSRPIPSGRIPGRWGLYIGVAWSLLALLVAVPLGTGGVIATVIALAFSWAYSMPPIRLKANGWLGNLAVGLTYEGLAWVTGAAIMLAPALPDARILGVALLYSLGAHGILTLNDFKAINGDRAMGVRSLPVQLGEKGAARVASIVMIVPQLVVIALLIGWGMPLRALTVGALVAIQVGLMLWFVRLPVTRALYLSAFGVPFYVAGMMVTAFGLRTLAAASVGT